MGTAAARNLRLTLEVDRRIRKNLLFNREIARFRLGGRARLGALYSTGEAPCDRRFVRFRIPSVQAGRLRSGEQLLSRSALSLFSLG